MQKNLSYSLTSQTQNQKIQKKKDRYNLHDRKSSDIQTFNHANSVFKIQANQIWLGDRQAADNIQWLRQKNIRTVFTFGDGLNVKYDSSVRHYLYSINDNKKQKILHYFNQVSEKIDKALRFSSILVHCGAGVSRSTTFVIAYLIRYKKLTFIQALRLIKEKRPIVCPNLGFQLQLKQYSTHWNYQIPRERNKELLSNIRKSKKEEKNFEDFAQEDQEKVIFARKNKENSLIRSTMGFDMRNQNHNQSKEAQNNGMQKNNIESLPEIKQNQKKQQFHMNININHLRQNLKDRIEKVSKQRYQASDAKKNQQFDQRDAKDIKKLRINRINYITTQDKQEKPKQIELKNLVSQSMQNNRNFTRAGIIKRSKKTQQVHRSLNSKRVPIFSAQYLIKVAQFRFGTMNAQKWNILPNPTP